MASLTMDVLRAAYDGPSATKRMAIDARVSVRAAEKWWARLATPRADVFLRMVQSNERLREELLRRLGGHGYGTDAAEERRVAATGSGGVAGAVGGLDRPADTGAAE